MTSLHPSQRILTRPRSTTPYGDLRNALEALSEALTEVEATDIPSDYALAELVWLAARAKAEALGVLAARLKVDSDDLRDAMEDPEAHPEIAEQVSNLVSGLVREI